MKYAIKVFWKVGKYVDQDNAQVWAVLEVRRDAEYPDVVCLMQSLSSKDLSAAKGICSRFNQMLTLQDG